MLGILFTVLTVVKYKAVEWIGTACVTATVHEIVAQTIRKIFPSMDFSLFVKLIRSGKEYGVTQLIRQLQSKKIGNGIENDSSEQDSNQCSTPLIIDSWFWRGQTVRKFSQ